ncbi:MAG: DNA/RNA nuclease SfsA [Pseudomonadota bacterium]|nr:DNA/RNA nuclease SfsA [Pseudomonadota bacterium]
MELPPLTAGRILRRYKRFLADVELESGEIVTAHCPNTGSMQGCWAPGARVEISHSDNPGRKLPWTLERVDMGGGWIGVNTGRVNAVIAEAIEKGSIPTLSGYSTLKREPAYQAPGFPKSRFDLLLTDAGERPDCYIEIKNATLLVNDVIEFPDAVTTRGRKHLELLAYAAGEGLRAVMLYAVNRPEGSFFQPAREIDPDYAETLQRVAAQRIEVLAMRLVHTTTGIETDGPVEVRIRKWFSPRSPRSSQ